MDGFVGADHRVVAAEHTRLWAVTLCVRHVDGVGDLVEPDLGRELPRERRRQLGIGAITFAIVDTNPGGAALPFRGRRDGKAKVAALAQIQAVEVEWVASAYLTTQLCPVVGQNCSDAFLRDTSPDTNVDAADIEPHTRDATSPQPVFH